MKTNLIILVLFFIIISCGTKIKPLLKAENDKSEAKLNIALVQQQDSIFEKDQKYRMKLNEIEKESTNISRIPVLTSFS